MKRSNLPLFILFVISIYVFSGSCKRDDGCKNNLFISTVTQTVAFTGESNGTVTVQATGDTSGIMYQIANGPFQSSSEFTGLSEGKYRVVITNAKKCTNSLDYEVLATDPCTVITVAVAAAKTDPFTGQSNGTITASASGGNDITFKLNNGAYQASGNFANLAPGTYTITAKNSYQCTGTAQVTLTAVDPCTVIKVYASANKTDPINNLPNGTITASAANDPSNMGGTPFTYRLNNNQFQSGSSFTGLAAGTYTVTARNSYGCTGSIQINLVNTPNCGAKTIVVTPVASQVVPCAGINGSISVSATTTSGPSALPFSFSLNMNGPFTVSTLFSNLGVGTYTVYAKDADGCVKASTPVAITTAAQGTNYTAVRTIINNKCLSCHNNTRRDGNVSFTGDCEVFNRWDRIKARTVDATSNVMPPPPSLPLTATEKAAINTWITRGHKYND